MLPNHTQDTFSDVLIMQAVRRRDPEVGSAVIQCQLLAVR